MTNKPDQPAGSKPCAHCGAVHAPFGLRLPGLRSGLAESYQVLVPFCATAACRAAVYVRRKVFMEKIGAGSKSRPVARPAKPADSGQGVLL